jgi:tRNA(adenine34) deaminase
MLSRIHRDSQNEGVGARAAASVAGAADTQESRLEVEPPVFESRDDQHFMSLALEQARWAAELDEVPVGAVVIREGRVVAADHNRINALCDPTAHAELLAVRKAASLSGYPRLVGATVYTTVEPCFMCAGALVQARVERVVWAVRDPKFGGCASLGRVLDDPRLNHRASITEGVRADEARELLRSFFRTKRDARRGL